MRNIIVLDNKAYIRNKIKEIVAEYDIHVYEAINSLQFFSVLAQINYEAELIILDLNLGNESGMEIIRKLNKKGVKIPIVVLTSENRRKEFANCIKAGAIDYILKPFDEKVLLKRIVGDIEKGKVKNGVKTVQEESEEAVLQFEKVILENMEEDKKLSVCMITFFKPVEEFTSIVEKEYELLANVIYPYLKKAIKGTELLFKHGIQSFIGTFLDISDESKKEIHESLNELIITLKEKSKLLKDYYLECVFVDYPVDGNNKEELISKAKEKTIEKINEIKNMEKK